MKPGNTPLVELRNMAPDGTRLFAKLEWYNPTGSIKDRPAWSMFHDAKRRGLLPDRKPLIEATSGNTGIGLARVALLYGHPCAICLPSTATEERKQILRAYGAELIIVPGGPNDAIAHAKELVAAGEGHMVYQYGNPANPAAHEFGTAPEIVRDWPLDAPADHLLGAYGTGGTLTGNSRGIKKAWPTTRVHSVEPYVEDPIGGMRSQLDPFQPPVADLSLVDERWEVSKELAEKTVHGLMMHEGHFAGTSSGAVVYAAQAVLDKYGGTAVALLPDAGWKYLSGSPWNQL
ncbi:MAG: cysteine synthase family protein [Acidimicrobiales bacterium]|nr:cysteine synthase family protein [Acidimicrobiales bacterium]